MYSIDVFDTWLYDDAKPFERLKCLDIFEALKKKADTGYFEELIEKYLLSNTHASVVGSKSKERAGSRKGNCTGRKSWQNIKRL